MRQVADMCRKTLVNAGRCQTSIKCSLAPWDRCHYYLARNGGIVPVSAKKRDTGSDILGNALNFAHEHKEYIQLADQLQLSASLPDDKPALTRSSMS